MPFITEQMWTTLTGGESLVIAQWPVANAAHVDRKAENLVGKLQQIITEVRRFRNDQGIKTSLKIPGRIVAKGEVADYASAVAFGPSAAPPAAASGSRP